MIKLTKLKMMIENKFETNLVDYAIESPYESYKNIKAKYPPWFSENMMFMWDNSGQLNSDTFKLDVSATEETTTRVIEAVTAEYVYYLIEQE